MSDLVIVAYKGEDTADQALNKLTELQNEDLVDLDDAGVVVRDKKGKLRIKQSVPLARESTLRGGALGGTIGLVLGFILLNPVLGLAAGAAAGAGAGAFSGVVGDFRFKDELTLADYGIDNQFIRSLGSELEPDASALVVLVRNAKPDKVLPKLSSLGGKILKTSLTTDQEQRLRQALSVAQK